MKKEQYSVRMECQLRDNESEIWFFSLRISLHVSFAHPVSQRFKKQLFLKKGNYKGYKKETVNDIASPCHLIIGRCRRKWNVFVGSADFPFHSPTGSSIVVLSGREPSNHRPARSITFCHSVTSLPTASIHSAGFP